MAAFISNFMSRIRPLKPFDILSSHLHTTRILSSDQSPRKITPPSEAEKLFLQPSIQEGLKRLIGFEADAVFSAKPVSRVKSPKYMLMTDEDLKVSFCRVLKKGRKYLEMIPFKTPYQEDVSGPEVLSRDPEIQGYIKSPIVFTDISLGSTDQTRLIVVREVNGILRRASREERNRMNQMFYPKSERLHYFPNMFEEKHLEEVLSRKEYKFILDRACLQFEPDDMEFHRILNTTFNFINDQKDFDCLRSNRYLGNMLFYLCINDKIDDVMRHWIDSGRIKEAATLVEVYLRVTEREVPVGVGAQDVVGEEVTGMENDLKNIRHYIDNYSHQKHILERCFHSLEERLQDQLEDQRQEKTA